VRNEAARVLGLNPTSLDANTPLSTLGFDSLMAVQLRNRVEAALRLQLPLVELLGGPTVAKVALAVASRLEATAVDTPTGTTTEAAAAAWEEGSL
jgi:acyl carrier protein